MAINIHFFRDSNLDKLDFIKVFEFFENMPEFKIYYTEEYVEILYADQAFDFSYRYLITKKSRVNNIYKINPLYSNINFLLEIPTLIPTFLVKEILTVAQRVCKLFELDIYHDSFDDVKAFNLVDLLVLFDNERAQYIEDFGMQTKVPFNSDMLNEICKYQRSVDGMRDYYEDEVLVNLVVPIVDRSTNEFGMSYTFHIGSPTLFPPHLSYINIIEDNSAPYLVRASDFYRELNKLLTPVDNFLPSMYIIKGRAARRAKREVKKLKKFALVQQNFAPVRLCDVIDV